MSNPCRPFGAACVSIVYTMRTERQRRGVSSARRIEVEGLAGDDE